MCEVQRRVQWCRGVYWSQLSCAIFMDVGLLCEPEPRLIRWIDGHIGQRARRYRACHCVSVSSSRRLDGISVSSSSSSYSSEKEDAGVPAAWRTLNELSAKARAWAWLNGTVKELLVRRRRLAQLTFHDDLQSHHWQAFSRWEQS